MIRGSQLGRTAKTTGTILTRTSRAAKSIPRRPAPPANPYNLNHLKLNKTKPSVFNHLKLNDTTKRGKYVSNLPKNFANAIRNRQVAKILGLKEERAHHLLKRKIARQLAHKPVPKKNKSPEKPFRGRPIILRPNAKALLKYESINVPEIITSILSQINTNPYARKGRSPATPRAKAKYLDSRSADPSRSVGLSRRYSKLDKIKVRKQHRQAAST